MNAERIDVLAVLDEAAFRIKNLREIAGYEPSQLPPRVREARAAVAELIAEFRQLIDDCDASGVTAFSKGKGFDESIERARAALTRIGGAA